MKPCHAPDGFTLLEVLVALAIFAITAIALLNIASQNTQSIEQNRLRTRAQFVAMNIAAEQQINPQTWTGSRTEQRDEQGQRWQVTQTTKPGPFPGVQRIEIAVAVIDADKGQIYPVTQLVRFQQQDQGTGS